MLFLVSICYIYLIQFLQARVLNDEFFLLIFPGKKCFIYNYIKLYTIIYNYVLLYIIINIFYIQLYIMI